MLVEDDGTWPRRFAQVADELRRVGDEGWIIEHIGSTSIPGMRAKPIIDVAVRLGDRADFGRSRPALEAAGWLVGSGVKTHPVMIREAGGAREHIAHFFAPEEWEHANQRVFRDWLRTHPDDAARYEAIKVAAADDSVPYNAAKTAIVQEILDRARAALGLPSVPADDK